jgi:thiamine biosynthesis protein ThiI
MTDDTGGHAVARVLAETWEFGHRPTLHVLDFSHVPEALRHAVRGSFAQLVLKRLMYRAGAAIARNTGAQALVTGESIGQVSSQTLASLQAIEEAAEGLPVFRPLLGFDKQDIVTEAKRIGTAPLSERVREFCALDYGPPVVAARPDRAAREEARLDDTVLARALDSRKAIDVLAVTPGALRMPYLFTESIPEDAVVVDCRPEALYRAWHVPGAVRMDPEELKRNVRALDKRKTYILYCSYGTQTPLLAEILQQFGYEAYAFRGGIAAVQRHVEGTAGADEADFPALTGE